MSLKEDGQTVPILDEEPELFDDLTPFWKAFQDLSCSKPNTGFGAGFIPYSEITDYLNEEHIFGYEDRHEYRKWITFIDREYMSLQSEKKKNEPKRKKQTEVKAPVPRRKTRRG